MKKTYFLLLALLLVNLVNAQMVTFTDENFKLKLLDANPTNTIAKNLKGAYFKIDTNNNQEIEDSEALQVSELNINGFEITPDSEIQYTTSVEGIQKFTNLKKLDCSYNTIENLNLAALTNLTAIDCENNLITSLNISGLINLNSLDCKSNLLASLNLTGLTNIVTLICTDNRLPKLNLTGLINLKTLDCGVNQLTTLDLREFKNLTDLWCYDNNLFSLYIKNGIDENLNDISGNPNLFYICLDDIQRDKVTALVAELSYLKCVLSNNCNASDPIINFTDPKFKAKLVLADSYNPIAETIDGIPIKIDENYDGEIQVKEALKVTNLYVGNSKIANLSGIEYFTNIATLDCSNNEITSLDLSKLVNIDRLECGMNKLSSLDITKLKKISHFNCKNNLLSTLSMAGLSNLNYIECQGNKLTSINFTGLNNLTYLDCSNNSLTSLSISNLNNLEILNCNTNKLTTVDFLGLTKIRNLSCGDNLLSAIVISGLTNLRYLEFWKNQITTIDLTSAVNLISLYAGNNPIKTFDFSKVPNLQNLWCGYTLISTLDLSNLKMLTGVNVSSCPNLESINLKNGSYEGVNFYEKEVNNLLLDGRNYSNCPKLHYICGDDLELEFIAQKIISYNYTHCVVGSYCSFTPGGKSYTIQGTTRFDSTNNGCDTSDSNVSNIKFSISNGDTGEELIANESGKYTTAVPEGFYSITPILENPTYFKLTPATAYADFTSGNASFAQDFCISANGVHNDLEVTILPLNTVVPGFAATYKISYKNKGTSTESGTIALSFNDAVLDYVSATPSVSTKVTDKLTWNYTNLKPFESREILLTLNNNSAVAIGSRLNFEAVINPVSGDEKPIDNSATLGQIVVNSNDSNIKECVEGFYVAPHLIGEYIHYIVRFENTGTNTAKNVVVKDIIDVSKFDMSTLVAIKSSHSYITKISNGNNVEFIFENINLSSNDALNDGYVAFKIKTLSKLIEGNSFKNEATIYFDYNVPIPTNVATSNLSASNFEFTAHFSVYPNPADNILNISAKTAIEVESMAVYDVLGQLVIAIPNAVNVSNIDVSRLPSGFYILKVSTEKGTSNVTFIKK